MTKTITMTELRRSPGERITDVVRNGDVFHLTKQGKHVATLSPPEGTVIESGGTIRGERPLTMGLDLGGHY
jgi:antitoxin (DNA-binding transcriptional repressor) of toxin-antitoxin stability system